MKITNVSNNFNKKNNLNPSFERIYIDPDFRRHNGLTQDVLDSMQSEIMTLEYEHPDKDCFIRRLHYDIFFPKIDITVSQKRPNGYPNKPGLILGSFAMNNDVYSHSLTMEENECKEYFDFKKNPEEAKKTFLYFIKDGFKYIDKCEQIEKEILADNPSASKWPRWQIKVKAESAAMISKNSDD